ncbi:MAG: hypothetical protein OXE59_08555 [Bacteroidetes bacterium]|nr:hypothetical protein [Bacteroidota bacterium]MCY4233769.1 hypothetical protein [Bacteroidota bacterium]
MKIIFALCFAIILAVPASAQNVASLIHNEEIRWSLTTEQIKSSLDSEYQSVREQTLKNAIVIVTLYRDKIDLTDERGLLRKIYTESKFSDNRKLALALLHTIGGDSVKEFLNENSTATELEEVRVTLASVLNDYYTNYHERRVVG